MVNQTPSFFVSFSAANDTRTAGMGFVVGDAHVLTCAHVINLALGRDLSRQDKPDLDEVVTLRLPTSGGAIRQARVEAWLPPPHGDTEGGDVAGLIITGEELPTGLKPAKLSRETQSEGAVRLFGYPPEAQRPARTLRWSWENLVSYQLRSKADGRLVRLRSDDPGAPWRLQWRSYSGAPLLDQASGTVVGMIQVPTDAESPQSYAIGATALREAWDEVLGIPPQNPYKGLASFDVEDTDVFVGREEHVARLKRAVQRSPFVLVTGPAGVGKSSLVQAGLLPALRKSGLWTTARCRPSRMPFQELAAALFHAEEITPSVHALRQRDAEIRGGGLADLADTIRIARGKRLLLVVDQLEELFTQGQDTLVVEQFLETILSLPETQRAVTVVATVRADYFHRLLAHPDAASRLKGRLVRLSAPSAVALRRMVQEPAGRWGVEFARGLVDRIVRDAGEDAAALPLLGFTLSELWSRQRQRVLTHEAYEEIGGLEERVRAHAESVITALADNGTNEKTLRDALLSLVSCSDEQLTVTRRRCPVDELPAGQQAVIETLVRAWLVTMSTDRAGRWVAELAHEVLVRAWPRLVRLAKDNATFIRWRGEVEQWQAKRYGLLPGSMIAEARRWCEERPEETESIRNLVERSEAHQRQSGQIAPPAMDVKLVARPLRRAKGIPKKDAPTSPDALEVTFRASRMVHNDWVDAVAFSPDGTRVATASHDHTARIFDAATGTEQARLFHDDRVLAVAFSPDRTWLATASHDHTARIFNVYSGAERSRLPHEGPVLAVTFSPDGTRLITACGDCIARVFEVTGGTELISREPSTAVKADETEPPDASVESRLRWIHRRSGLTWDQIAKLFGVSRRAVHSWVAGGRINAANSEHLGSIVRTLQELPYDTPERTRELLMHTRRGTPSLFDRLRNKKSAGLAVEDTISVRELLGIQEQAEEDT